jgi:hypothetical protein
MVSVLSFLSADFFKLLLRVVMTDFSLCWPCHPYLVLFIFSQKSSLQPLNHA